MSEITPSFDRLLHWAQRIVRDKTDEIAPVELASDVLSLHQTLTARAEQAEREIHDAKCALGGTVIDNSRKTLAQKIEALVEYGRQNRQTIVEGVIKRREAEVRAEQAERERDALSQKMCRDALDTIPFVRELLESNAQLARQRAVVEAAQAYFAADREEEVVLSGPDALTPKEWEEWNAAFEAVHQKMFQTYDALKAAVAALEDPTE